VKAFKQWLFSPAFTFTVNEDRYYVKTWTVLVAVFLIGWTIG
jgi:hypothetical protein